MNKEDIRLLLHRFYLGETTIDEERRLISLLLSDDCPDDLKAERHAVISLAKDKAVAVPEDLVQKIETAIRTADAGLNPRWWMGIAAGLLLIIGIGLWALLPKNSQPELSQQKAVAETVPSVQSAPPQPDKPITPKAPDLPSATSGAQKHYPKQTTPIEASADIQEIDLAAEVADILANIDQLEQQILATNPQSNN